MFWDANEFNHPVGNWDVSNVTEMNSMFKDATNFNQDLSSWSVSNVLYCVDFCAGATNWTLPKPNFSNCLDDNLGCD